jgi:hypothetical protein
MINGVATSRHRGNRAVATPGAQGLRTVFDPTVRMFVERSNLWELARSGRLIDAQTLADALSAEVAAAAFDCDFRTELLVRDGLDALAGHWGRGRTEAWVDAQPSRDQLCRLWAAPLGSAGFPTLGSRIMDATRPDTILQMFRELGTRLARPAKLEVGGSTALILAGLLTRQTDDVDVVDALPDDVRSRHDLLAELATAYGLSLTHFQSHYLPDGWQDRLRSLGRFGRLDVYVVDVYDVLVSKLTSVRRKDRDDLRALAGSTDRQVLADRLRTAGATLLAEPRLAQNAAENWYVVYGEPLPTAP